MPEFNKKILIIEDEAVLLNVLKNRFEEDGWDVVTAEDGEVAMTVLNQEKPDLILLDLILPKKDGFEVLKEVKSDPELQQLPVIVLSNLGADEDIKKALSLGASDYFVKTQHPIGEILEKAEEYQKAGQKAQT